MILKNLKIMTNPLLSILIPTIVGREEECSRLVEKIMANTHSSVEVTIEKDNKEITIGEKREKLYKQSNGLFSWQVDDDDDISDDAIELILKAIKENPDVDCVTFEERVRLDGVEFKSNHSLSYFSWEGDGTKELSDGFHFWRTPFFKSVIKTEIAKSVPIPHCRWGEDNMWADELRKVLKTEYHINKQLYYYDYIQSPHNERYGIK